MSLDRPGSPELSKRPHLILDGSQALRGRRYRGGRRPPAYDPRPRAFDARRLLCRPTCEVVDDHTRVPRAARHRLSSECSAIPGVRTIVVPRRSVGRVYTNSLGSASVRGLGLALHHSRSAQVDAQDPDSLRSAGCNASHFSCGFSATTRPAVHAELQLLPPVRCSNQLRAAAALTEGA